MALYKVLRLPSAPAHVQDRNRSLWNRGRSRSDADFYTVGYVGRSPSELVDALLSGEVRCVLDIRYTPVSQYRPEFSKSNLRSLLQESGIDYQHHPGLGVPRDIRGLAVGAKSRDVIWDWYDANIVTEYVGRNLHHFFNAVDHPVALLCVEADPTACHRHRLSIGLEGVGLRSYDL